MFLMVTTEIVIATPKGELYYFPYWVVSSICIDKCALWIDMQTKWVLGTVGLQLRRECSLGELMDHETCMVKQIRSLDSDMQTLVYENYNKFISATGEKISDSQSSFT